MGCQGPYRGYDAPRGQREDAFLTHVGWGTPGGEYLRRFWHPVALECELTDVPLALTVLGEDLVLFRDGRGETGLLHRRCSHRGASLEFGIIAERGIRCCYHGQVIDVDGTILETPAEPESRARRTCHGAYPTELRDGLVFAYMGPPDHKPPLPSYDTIEQPDDNELAPFKLTYPCNWLQVHENTADPMHIPFLHGRVSGAQFGPGFGELPALSFVDTPLGMAVASTRQAGGRVWVRCADVMLPNVAQYPPAFETGEDERIVVDAWATRWVVPQDDTHSWVIGYRHFNARLDPHGQGDRGAVGLESVDFAGQTAASGDERQRAPGDYEAIVGQGSITIHATEHLVASDRGVVRFRRLLRDAIERLRTDASSGVAATYTAEVILRAPAPLEPAALEAIGDMVLATLIETAAEASSLRAERIRERVGAFATCP